MKRLVALALMLLLPLQVMAGIVMPFCKQAMDQQAMAQQHLGDGHAMHQHDAGDDQHHHDSGPSNCDGCGLCHLACAGFLPMTPSLAMALNDGASPTRHNTLLTSVIPQQPQRPPLPSVA